MSADLLADLPQAVQDRARALLTVSSWAGKLQEVRAVVDSAGRRVTLVCTGGYIEFLSEADDAGMTGKGPTDWQKLILDRVATGEQFYLVDLLPKGYSQVEYNTLVRAARQLQAAGRISWVRYMSGNRKTLIGPPGAGMPPTRPKGFSRHD